MIILNSAISAAALVFYLPGMCTQTDRERPESGNILKSSEKNTIFNEHPVHLCIDFVRMYVYIYLLWKDK